MTKLVGLTLIAAAVLAGTSYVRLQWHLGDVKLVTWGCPGCSAANVSDVNEAMYPSCRKCGEKLGWDEMVVAEGL